MAVVPPAKVAVVVAGSVVVVVAGGVVVAAGGADEPADELSGSQPVFCKAKATSMTTANITRITMLTRKAIRRALRRVPLFLFRALLLSGCRIILRHPFHLSRPFHEASIR